MKLSTDRILTTHTGSLPRPAGLREASSDGQAAALRDAVGEVVGLQVNAGIDIVSDGEMSKPSYSTYVADRVSGFGGQSGALGAGLQSDAVDFPEWGAQLGAAVSEALATPACVGEVQRSDMTPVTRDVENLRDALGSAGATEGFMTAASPGVITMFLENQFYPSHEAYLEALTELMRSEYEAIHASGLVLQIDCPDLAVGRHVQYPEMELVDWKRVIEGHIEAVNEATREIPPESLRIHLCWGNYEGPHNHDVPLREILPLVYSSTAAGDLFRGRQPAPRA